MGLRFETRRSDSPWVDAVWTCTSEQVTAMTSVAGVRCGLVFWQQAGRAYAGITGPETRTGTAPVPEGASFTGIELAVGTSLRAVPTPALVDGGIGLPTPRAGRSVWTVLGGRRPAPTTPRPWSYNWSGPGSWSVTRWSPTCCGVTARLSRSARSNAGSGP